MLDQSEADPRARAHQAFDFLATIAAGGLVSAARMSPDGGAPGGGTFDPKGNRDAVLDWLAKHAGADNLYFRLNEPKRAGKGGALKEQDIARLRGVAVDIDPRPDADFDAERARLAALADELRGWTSPPTFIVDSGNGIQAGWLLPEPLDNTPENAVAVKAQAKALAEKLGGDATHDLARLLRLPFTTNFPNEKKRARGRAVRPAELLHLDETKRAALEALAEIAPPGAAHPGTTKRAVDFEYADVLDTLGDPGRLRDRLRIAAEDVAARYAEIVGEAAGDRSACDYRIGAHLVRVHAITDPTELAQALFAASPDKITEEVDRGRGEYYAGLTVAAVLEKNRPNLRPEDFFSPIGDAPATGAPAAARIRPTPFAWRDPSTIPPRRWLYGRVLIGGFVSLTVSPGGLGKSALLIAEALAMATGRPLLGESVVRPLRVWYWNGEDPGDELERRVMAAHLHFGTKPADVADRLFIDSGRSAPIRIASDDKGAVKVDASAVEQLVAAILEARADVVIVDPLITTHAVDENVNGAMNAVVSAWRSIADRTSCAVMLVHHSKKAAISQGEAMGVEQARGASALIDGVRCARFLLGMTDKEARAFGLPSSRGFFRVEVGKANLAPRPAAAGAVWRRLASVGLGNAVPEYPEGDYVGVAEPWTPPRPLDGVSEDERALALGALASGEGKASEQAEGWAGALVADVLGLDVGPAIGGRTEEQQAARAKVRGMLKAWLEKGALAKVKRRDPVGRRDAWFLALADTRDAPAVAMPDQPDTAGEPDL